MGEVMSCRRDQLTQSESVWLLKARSIQLNIPLLPSEVVVYCLVYCNTSVEGNHSQWASLPTLFLVTAAQIYSFFSQELYLQNPP